MDPLYWRLIYGDDHVEDEPRDNASIRLSHRGAVMLQACVPESGIKSDGNGTISNRADLRRAVFQVRLIDAESNHLFTPVFYRKRSLTPGAGSELVATVLGRVREGEHTIDGTLWISYDGQTFEDCPEWAIDQAAINGIMAGV